MVTTLFLYICLLAYMGMFAVLYDKYVTILLFFVLLLVPVVLFILMLVLQRFVKVRFQEKIGVINKGEDIQVIIEVENRGIFPIADVSVKFSYWNAFSGEKKSEMVPFSLPGRKKEPSVVKKVLVLSSEYCGNIVVSCDYVKIYDYLHLTAVRKRPKRNKKMISQTQVMVSVLPELQEKEVVLDKKALIEDVFSMENESFSKTKCGDDPSEIFDIREYREGDRIHRIHWKLSSKRGQWMVKDFSLPVTCSAAVLLDLYKSKKEEDNCSFMDRKLSEALSFSYSLVQQEIQHKFVWLDGKDGQLHELLISREEEFYEMMEQLLYARPYGEVLKGKRMRKKQGKMDWFSAKDNISAQKEKLDEERFGSLTDSGLFTRTYEGLCGEAGISEIVYVGESPEGKAYFSE